MGNRITLRRKNHQPEMEWYDEPVLQGLPIEGQPIQIPLADHYGIYEPLTIRCDHCGHEMKIFS